MENNINALVYELMLKVAVLEAALIQTNLITADKLNEITIELTEKVKLFLDKNNKTDDKAEIKTE